MRRGWAARTKIASVCMDKLSVLIFSKDYVNNTLNLVKDVHGIADEIILMDASGARETAELKRGKDSMKLSKLRIFHAPPIGYPDPLRMYGLKKCTGKWILYIDTDERISDDMKKDIGAIIANREFNAYAIKRYEEVKNPDSLPFFATWQIRLFRKDSVTFTGLPHEQASIRGNLGRLDGNKYFMMHLSALMSRKTQLDYNEIEKFERLTYGMYNQKVLGYLSKLFLHEDRNPSKTMSGKMVLALVKGYQRITFKKEAQELTNFDYFFYYATLDLVYYTIERNLSGLLNIVPKERAHVRQINKWQNDPDGSDVLEISKILNKIGITEFLHLDREEVIKRINKRKEIGAKLLLALIKERYRETASKD